MEIDGMEQKLIRKRQDEFEAEGKEYAAYYDNEETILEERSKVPYLHFGSFDRQEWLQLSFSTRLGGVTDKDYLSSLNFGWDRGDKEENVRENYRRMCKALGTDYKKLILSDQVHGDKIEYEKI